MLFLVRYYVSDSKVFLFLNWNLFLAFIPLIVSSIVIKFEIKSKIALFLAIVIWIIFFPNSPYILTDLFHLKTRSSIPIWYDLIVILAYAWTGLMFGFVSLLQIEKLLSEFLSELKINILVILFFFISSFGVYLGRFLRWNSWDILTNPFGLFQDITHSFIYPLENTKTWGVTLLMGILLNFMYFSIKIIKNQPTKL
jgi:uncharacterized membrane protein